MTNLFITITFLSTLSTASASTIPQDWNEYNSPVHSVNWHFENGSPLTWEIAPNGHLIINPIHGIDSTNFDDDVGHWHFQLFADQNSDVTIEINGLSVHHGGWHGTHISDKTHCFISPDGTTWKPISADRIAEDRIQFQVYMKEAMIYISRSEPYRVSDLERLKAEIKEHPQVEITPIGHTVQGRELEIIRIGKDTAPSRVFLRIRPHCWEVSGSWVIQGLIRKLTSDDEDAQRYLRRYCVYTMPMANKDGIHWGKQYYSITGYNLNTGWQNPADPKIAPENYALEQWLKNMIEKGRKPHLAIDWHNDVREYIYCFRKQDKHQNYLRNMERIARLLRKHTWYTSTELMGKNRWVPRVMTAAFSDRYQIDSFGIELNIDWSEGLQKPPMGKDWELFGEQLCEVLYGYFSVEQ